MPRWFRVIALAPAAAAEDASASLAGLGCSGVRIHDGDPAKLEAHFEKDVADAARAAVAPWDGRVEIAEWVEEEDWATTWRNRVPAMVIGKFCIHPTHEPDREGKINITIDPGMAFGTGDHPTTRLMLLEVEALAGTKPLGRVLDFGCGSGILAMAAVRLGASEVVAVDTDRNAIDESLVNARMNKVERIHFIEGSLGKCSGKFDTIVANVTSEVHLQIIAEYRKKLTPGGRLRIGGVRTEEAESVARVTGTEPTRTCDGWAVLRPVGEGHAKSEDPSTKVMPQVGNDILPPPEQLRRGALHHMDLNVSDLAESVSFYSRLLPRFGYQKAEAGEGWQSFQSKDFTMTLVQAKDPFREDGYHRKRVGVNHLAFAAASKEAVDILFEWCLWEGIPVLYDGPKEMGSAERANYALFFEDPDRLKLEYVYRP